LTGIIPSRSIETGRSDRKYRALTRPFSLSEYFIHLSRIYLGYISSVIAGAQSILYIRLNARLIVSTRQLYTSASIYIHLTPNKGVISLVPGSGVNYGNNKRSDLYLAGVRGLEWHTHTKPIIIGLPSLVTLFLYFFQGRGNPQLAKKGKLSLISILTSWSIVGV
jgi:hypothetical protein